MNKNPIILALDVEPEQARATLNELKDAVEIVKIGNRLFTAIGPEVVRWAHAAGKKVFLDLKFHDIPVTVGEACRNAAAMGVWGLTIHASGGFGMMKEAAKTVAEESQKLKKPKLLIFGVTVLTSHSQDDLKEQGISDTVPQRVERLAKLAKDAGLDGTVSSGHEIELVKKACGKDFLTVVPGIRPAKGAAGDQKRIMTPKQAVELGADYLVIGRPILEAKDRTQAAKEILEEIR